VARAELANELLRRHGTMPATRSGVGLPTVTKMASRTARVCVHFETELVDELLGADERRVGGGVECVTAVIELLAPPAAALVITVRC
jgi:hypothetical protein